jgi:signal transduction histidine kinase
MSFLALIYLLTIIVSIAIAFLLVYFANLSSKSRQDVDKYTPTPAYPKSPPLSDKDIKKTLYKELNEFVESKESCQKIAENVSDIFRKELDKEIVQISAKYEGVIKEKSANEEIAWKKYEKTLVEKKQTESVIRSIAEGLVVLNDRNEVIMMNPAAEKMLEVQIKNQTGKPIQNLIKDTHLMSLATGNQSQGDVEIELNAGSENAKKVLRSSSAVIQNESGKTVGMVSVFTDVTKQKELEELKSQFLSNVSHEFRTPLVAARNSIIVVLGESANNLTENQKKYLSIAEKNIKQLGRFIDDLLDVSKMEAKKMELRPTSVSIGTVIDETRETLETWARTKNITIAKKVQDNIPEIKMDKGRITQVLVNLIGNSIKFTPNDGTVTVEASLKKEEKGEILMVRVMDTGPGIAKEDIPKLFNRFQQLDKGHANTKISGTGLGLSIAKELIELHGGTIYAESEPGKGAIFTFKIPVV